MCGRFQKKSSGVLVDGGSACTAGSRYGCVITLINEGDVVEFEATSTLDRTQQINLIRCAFVECCTACAPAHMCMHSEATVMASLGVVLVL
jgi:hypothetical protein